MAGQAVPVSGAFSIPDFMSLDFDPTQGPHIKIFTPLSSTECLGSLFKQIAPQIMRDVALGAIIGAATSSAKVATKIACGPGLLMFVEKVRQVRKCALYGALFGARMGLIAGTIRSIPHIVKFYQDVSIVGPQLEECTGKAAQVLSIFVDTVVDQQTQASSKDLLCPISQQVMAFPVKLPCNHTFEYAYILQELKTNQKCPCCRAASTLQNLELDTERRDLIIQVAGKIFIQLENIFSNLPEKQSLLENFSNNPLDFTESELMNNVASSIREGEKLLEAPVADLVAKIEGFQPLSISESYALGFYLVHQFKPLQQNIKKAYQETDRCLFELYEARFLSEELLKQRKQNLVDWYFAFKQRIIPSECRIVRKLYNA